MTNKQKGFTLIELMLAMAFIAFMLLFITSAILQATKLYVKGSAIRQINQAGRQVLSDISTKMRYSTPTNLLGKNRLCVGGVSYIWNIEGTVPTNTFAAPNSTAPLHLVSLDDPSGNLCVPPYGAIDKTKTTSLVGDESTVLQFVVSHNVDSSLWDVSLILSTGGSNLPLFGQSTPTTFACASDNQFCAFGDFKTSIYSRAGGM